MKRTLVLGALALALSGCPETTPTELVPTFDALTGLPGLPPSDGCSADDCCLSAGWCLDVETLSVRNVGSSAVTIESVTFAAAADDPDGVDAFSDLEINTMEIAAGEQANLRFRYTTPNGEAQKATIVIASNAAANPTLEVSVETNAYTPPAEEDAGPAPDAGEQDSGVVDAGTDVPDAGEDPTDVDAGDDDAGESDAG